MSLVNLEVSAQFLIHMKVTFLCALVLAVPYLIYEIWKFVLPALYENEKRAVRGALGFASVLFYIGLAVAYSVIFPFMLNFFASYQVSPDVPNNFSLSSYISMFVSTMLAFGIVQVGLSLKSHDPSQRANGFLTVAGGIIITFTKEILLMITA